LRYPACAQRVGGSQLGNILASCPVGIPSGVVRKEWPGGLLTKSPSPPQTVLAENRSLGYTSVHVMTSPTETVVLFSGGLDSAACAHFLKAGGHSVRGLFIDYGQKAAPWERAAAERLSAALKIDLSEVSIRTRRSFGTGEIRGRNALLIFSSMLDDDCGRAQVIALGIHAGTAYYDCSPPFVEAVDRLVAEYTDGRTRVLAPFVQWTKRDIFTYSLRAGLPVQLSYSCEAGGLPPCGSCLSCRDRRMLACLC